MQNNQPLPMYTLLNLNEDCQAISVSNEFKDLAVGTDAGALKEAFAKKKASGKDVKVAMTFPGGTHDLWIRYWMAAAGIDPDKDVQTIVVPPPQMVANMKVGNMDAFCVGEPWNEQLVNQGIGFTACTTGELWFKHPEKILGMRADWVDANPKATLAILAAVMEAQIWCDKMENKQEMAEIIGRRQWFNVPVPDIIGRIKGDINYGRGKVANGTNLGMKFWGKAGEASYPWKSLDAWFVTENIRWGKFETNTDIKALVNRTNRSDLWSEGAKLAGLTGTPTGDSRGVEKFFDGKTFDWNDPHWLPRLAQPEAHRLICSGRATLRGHSPLLRRRSPHGCPCPQSRRILDLRRQTGRASSCRRGQACRWHGGATSEAQARGRARKMALKLRDVAVVVVPPLLVVAAILLIWQIAFGRPGASLPAPTVIWAEAKDLIVDRLLRHGTQDIGLGWRVLTSLERVFYGFGLAAIVGVCSAR